MMTSMNNKKSILIPCHQLNVIIAFASGKVMFSGRPPKNFRIFNGRKIGSKNVFEFSSISSNQVDSFSAQFLSSNSCKNLY